MDTESTPRPVSRAYPCVVCGGDHACSRKADGVIFCKRRQGAQPGFVYLGEAKDGTWGMYRADDDLELQRRNEERQRERDDFRRGYGAHHNGSNGNGNAAAPKPSKNWQQLADQFGAALTPDLKTELAQSLGVPEWTLDELESLGWKGDEKLPDDDRFVGCWTFPERDAEGRIVGINRRWRNGEKMAMHGGKRGLTIPRDWDRGGDVYLPEGASNTLALLAMGLSVVGRPNNLAGDEDLAKLLRDLSADRKAYVIGDVDPKMSGEWPGRDGAAQTAAKVNQALSRQFSWSFTPAAITENPRDAKDARKAAKDSRVWFHQTVADVNDLHACRDAGTVFAEAIKKQARIPRPEEARQSVGYKFEPMSLSDFLATDYRHEWLVKRCFVKGEVGILGGAKKTLKTSIAVDLYLSLVTGTPFLGYFDIYHRQKTCLISGESGEATLKKTVLRVMEAKGMRPADAPDVAAGIAFKLPQLSRPADLLELSYGLREQGYEVLIFDPLYLALLAGQKDISASNLYEIGPLLSSFTRACLDAGVTPIILHHFRKSSQPGEELDLNSLAFAGVAEFARQWFLLGRREAYVPGTGLQQLTMVVGGSAGQSGSWSLDIDEGVMDDELEGRKWEVRVEPTHETKKSEATIKEQQRKEKDAEKLRREETDFMVALDRLTAKAGSEPVSRNNVRAALGWNDPKTKACAFRLELDSIVDLYRAPVMIGSGAKKETDCVRRRRET